jgi:phage terminase large subunit-like protein
MFRKGCTEPRVWTKPLRELTPATTRGFECIKFAEDVLEIQLVPWQKWLLIHALELLPDGSFRFRTVVLLVARQNGKSTLLQVLSLWRMYVDSAPLTIGTAQNLDTAEETWQGALDIAEGIPDLADEIAHIERANGKKTFTLTSRERYKVASASRRGGRGLSGDLVLLDELREHRTWDAWAAVTKTTMARLHAQVWAASNAGDKLSIVLAYLRLLAHLALGNPDGLSETLVNLPEEDELEADEDTLGIFEWSAPPGCPINDRDGWAQANPSLGYLITERAIRAAMRTDPEGIFRTEVLCQWVEFLEAPPIDPAKWAECYDPDSVAAGSPVFGIGVSWESRSAAIVSVTERPDGLPHVELVEHRPGVDWVVKRCAELDTKHIPAAWILDPATGAGALLPDLKNESILPHEMTVRELGQACEDLAATVKDVGLRHLGDTALSRAMEGAGRRDIGDGLWAWSRKRSGGDIAPLMAMTLGLWGFSLYGVGLGPDDVYVG